MTPRLNYTELAPEGLAKMRALEHYLNTATGLDTGLLELVRLLASELNGCEYCIHMHSHELQKRNETPDRIASVQQWRETDVYTHRERAALDWTEALTNIQDGHAPDELFHQLREHFSEPETVNLTLAITTINAWNRIAISLGAHSGRSTP